MRFLFVLEHFYPYTGGAELLFYHLTTSLAELGHEVRVITTRYDQNLPVRETYKGLTIHRINCRNRYFFTFLALPAVVKQAHWADIIHTTSYNAGFPACIGALIKNKKVTITFHEVWGNLWWKLPFINPVLRPFYYGMEWVLLHLPFNSWIAVSESTRQALEHAGISPKRISTIYNGIDYDALTAFRSFKPNNEKFQFLYFGRQGVSKGIDLILPAFEIMAKSYPNIELHLVLSNRPNQISRWIKKRIRDSEALRDSVTISYDLPRELLYKAVADADAVLIPSYSEGFCFAALETIAIGTPLICSGRGSLSEVVGGKVIIMDSLSVDGLYRSMELAIKNKWQDLPPKRFELATFIKRHMLFYRDMLNN